jgi:hypothetical protein
MIVLFDSLDCLQPPIRVAPHISAFWYLLETTGNEAEAGGYS